jgi:4-hydroxythreonine-4-phosphate dehydrogenase
MTITQAGFRPRLVIALGDPASIGAEVVLKALADRTLTETCDLTLVGSRLVLEQTYHHLKPEVLSLTDPEQFHVVDIPLETPHMRMGVSTGAGGEASFRYLETAIDRTLAGEFQGVVTAPIAKSAWKAAGHHYPGQTEFLAEKAGADLVGMLFVARSPHTGWTLRTLLATTHIPLCQVSEALTPDLMQSKLELLLDCLQQDFGIAQPRIAIPGLNPHSGEQGQLGREEVDWLLPWLEAMRQLFPHAQLDGLVPPDTMWVRPGQAWFSTANYAAAHDAYLALYHDQGLIPVKLMAFDRAVNTTIGLPFIRTSPDHGTAFDIAGKGIADATSFKAALQLAIDLAQHRMEQSRQLAAIGD